MDIEERVYNYLLENHVGKDNMIKNKELRFALGIKTGDKSMRKIIQNINQNKRFERMVGSLSGKMGGFFICETKEECIAAINNKKHRANQMLRDCHVMEWKSEVYNKC